MTEKAPSSFAQEIEANKNTELVFGEAAEAARIETDQSALGVRYRGCFVTELQLTSPVSGERVDVLYSDPDLTVPKLTASHVMSPAGPSEGIGGQHGFPRWADYQEFPLDDGTNGEKRVIFEALRSGSDGGIALSKAFEVANNKLSSHTTLFNPGISAEQTSIGEHYYFTLEDERSAGIKLNGKSLDELLGDGAEATIMNGEALFFDAFDGTATIDFPAGHSIRLSAQAQYDKGATTSAGLGMLIWHKSGNKSICFEPTIGLAAIGDNQHLMIPPQSSATLISTIELL